MNTRVFKIFKGHVIASVYIFVNDSILETFPSQTFVFNDIWRNFLRRLRRGRQSKFGRRSLGWGGFNKSRWINIKYLGRLMGWRRIRLDYLVRAMPGFLASSTGEIFQIQVLGQSLPFIPSRRTNLRFNLMMSPLTSYFFPFVSFHGCHSLKKKKRRKKGGGKFPLELIKGQTV